MQCIICNNNSWKPFYQKLNKCTKCGFVRAKDRYFKFSSEKIYTKDKYFISADYANYELERPALEKNFTDRLKRIRKFKKKGKLLEIGPAYGYFLNLAKKYYSCTGIELDPTIAKIASDNSGVKVLSGNFIKQKLANNSYDIVCMFDVIEHLKTPDLFVKKISNILKPNGILVIETGDIEAFLPKIRKEKWRLITPPVHLQYFSEKSLSSLLNKNSLNIINKHKVPFYRTVGQTLFRGLNIKNNSPLFRYLHRYYFPVNTFDLLFLIAQKPHRS